MLKVKLHRDLRKQILRGHPWVYRQSIDPGVKADRAQICEILDKKGKFIAWGYYDPYSPIALRCLTAKAKPPQRSYFEKLFADSLELRQRIIGDKTNTFRLFHGEGDRLPGLVCDIYDDVAVIQFDGRGPLEFWDQDHIAEWLLERAGVTTVILKPRKSDGEQEPQFWGETLKNSVISVRENGCCFLVNVIDGQKTGFFLDQRENRKYVSLLAQDKKMLNLFSYSGGFSIYAGRGGANHVTSVDISQGALDLAHEAWKLSELDPSQHQPQCQDVFEFLDLNSEKYDLIVVDPPSMTHSEKLKPKAITAYIDIFTRSIKALKPRGHICFSSCSSHINFEDFLDIIDESLSKAKSSGRIHRISGQGADHPIPHICREMRYLKFVHLQLDEV